MILWICMEQETPVLVRVVVLSFLKVDYRGSREDDQDAPKVWKKGGYESSGLLRCVLDVAFLE